MDELASVTPGKESRAMTSFANALRWSFDLFMLLPLSLSQQFDSSIILLLYRQLPSIIAENGGYDSAQLVSELKAKHILGESTMVFFRSWLFFRIFTSLTQGLNMYEGKVGCMQELGITESFSVKRQVLVQASEAAEMILRFAK